MLNEEKLDRVMIELGHRENLAGSACIEIGVALYERGMSFTKDLYPAIAAAVDSTPARVERNMRHAIESAWERGDMEAQYRYFGSSIDPDRGCPTVSEFITRVAKICHEN